MASSGKGKGKRGQASDEGQLLAKMFKKRQDENTIKAAEVKARDLAAAAARAEEEVFEARRVANSELHANERAAGGDQGGSPEVLVVADEVSENVTMTIVEQKMTAMKMADDLCATIWFNVKREPTRCFGTVIKHSDAAEIAPLGTKEAKQLDHMKIRAVLQPPPEGGGGGGVMEGGGQKRVRSESVRGGGVKKPRSESDRVWLPQWLRGREEWLRHRSVARTFLNAETGVEEVYIDCGMFCIACEAAQIQNTFTQPAGCSSFRLTVIQRHEETKEHAAALKAPKRAVQFDATIYRNIVLEVTPPLNPTLGKGLTRSKCTHDDQLCNLRTQVLFCQPDSFLF
jgi:hypothetical protein